MGAEVTDFLIVLNSKSAVGSFMSAGSLTLGGNFSVAVGPLGRNAEGSGALNAKGQVAAMYSYSKTKGLFGGVSVEGSVIVERQDANRLAFGSSVSVKQILSGTFDPPPWSNGLIQELEAVSGGGGGGGGSRNGHQKWRSFDGDGEGGDDDYGLGPGYGDYPSDEDRRRGGGRNRSESTASSNNYAFSGTGNIPTTPNKNRSRSSSLFGSNAGDKLDRPVGRSSPRPSIGKRASSFIPFGGGGSTTPKKGNALPPSSESYNAGLTWDSSGPMTYGGRSRSTSNAQRPSDDDDLLGDFGKNGQPPKLPSKPRPNGMVPSSTSHGDDLLGSWDTNEKGLSTSFAKLTTSPAGGRSRSGSQTQRAAPPFEDIAEDEYVPYVTESKFARSKLSTPPLSGSHDFDGLNGHDRNGYSGFNGSTSRKQLPASSIVPSQSSPFGQDVQPRKPFDDYFEPPPDTTQEEDPFDRPRSGRPSSHGPNGPKPSLSLKAGLGVANDGFPRAVALFDFAASHEGDLVLKKGEVVVVHDKVGKGDWWKGVKVGGKTGIFPKSYVEVLDIPKPLKGGVERTELKARMASPFE